MEASIEIGSVEWTKGRETSRPSMLYMLLSTLEDAHRGKRYHDTEPDSLPGERH